MSIKELVEKIKGEWEGIFIEQEDDIRNIFLSNLDVSISIGISLEVTTIEETNYLAGKLNLICEGELKAKELGKMRSEGKDYVVQDGDVMHFLFNN